jgi:hypothetical protein
LAAFVVADRAASPAAHFGRLGRLAPDHDETLDRFRWIADHPTQSQISKTFDLLAVRF